MIISIPCDYMMLTRRLLFDSIVDIVAVLVNDGQLPLLLSSLIFHSAFVNFSFQNTG